MKNELTRLLPVTRKLTGSKPVLNGVTGKFSGLNGKVTLKVTGQMGWYVVGKRCEKLSYG